MSFSPRVLAAGILVAMTASASAAEKQWFVVMGSFAQGSAQADELAYVVGNQCGLGAMIGDGFDFVGMTPDVTFVYLGPYDSRTGANGALKDARNCVSDAYVKSATPRDGDEGGE